MEKLSKKKHCLKVPSVLCLASHVALSNVTAAKKFFLHNLWTKELKRGVGPNKLWYVVQLTFLSSPIACVACERLELLKTEITGRPPASKLF